MTRAPGFVCCVTPQTSRRVCLSVAMFKPDRGMFARIGLAQILRGDDIVDTGLCADIVSASIKYRTETKSQLVPPRVPDLPWMPWLHPWLDSTVAPSGTSVSSGTEAEAAKPTAKPTYTTAKQCTKGPPCQIGRAHV